MDLPQPYTGMVIRYDYLWHNEQLKGIENGLKARPCAIVLTDDHGTVKVAPITHAEPGDLSLAIEIPAKTALRLGLDGEKSWVICSEVNEFIWPGYDLRTVLKSGAVEYGTLPPDLYKKIITKIAYLARGRVLKSLSRNQ